MFECMEVFVEKGVVSCFIFDEVKVNFLVVKVSLINV